MTLEPPKGLRANLVRAYLRFTDKVLNDCNKPEDWKRLVFATCLFHAVIQERRKFGPLGWNIRYDFTDGDLSVCQVQVRMFLNEYEHIPYKVKIPYKDFDCESSSHNTLTNLCLRDEDKHNQRTSNILNGFHQLEDPQMNHNVA